MLVELLDRLLFDPLDLRPQHLDLVVDFAMAIFEIGFFLNAFFDSRSILHDRLKTVFKIAEIVFERW